MIPKKIETSLFAKIHIDGQRKNMKHLLVQRRNQTRTAKISIGEVSGRVLGSQRVDAMLRLTLAEREARRCRTELMFEEYED